MERLTITAHMKTPFITGGGYMTFDALLAGCDTDQVKFEGAWHKFNKVAGNTREPGDYENFAKEIQQLASKGYAPALLDSIMGQRYGYFPKNSKLIKAQPAQT